MLAHVRAGIAASRRHGRLLALLYLANLAFAALFAQTFLGGLGELLDRSVAGSSLTSPFSMDLFIDLTARHSRAWSTFISMVMPLSVVFALLHVYLAGVVAALTVVPAAARLSDALASSARRLGRHAVASAIVLAFALVPVLSTIGAGGALSSELTRGGSEVPAFLAQAGGFVLAAVFGSLFLTIQLQARLRIARSRPGEHGGTIVEALRAVVMGCAHTFRHAMGAWRLFLLVALSGLAVLAVQLVVEMELSTGSSFGLFAFVAISQLLLLARLFVRLVHYGSQADHLESHDPASVPALPTSDVGPADRPTVPVPPPPPAPAAAPSAPVTVPSAPDIGDARAPDSAASGRTDSDDRDGASLDTGASDGDVVPVAPEPPSSERPS